MSVFNVFDVTGSGMSAQMLRLNTVASNLANSQTISANANEVYQARHPIFQTVLQQAQNPNDDVSLVKVQGIMTENTPAIALFRPNHPLANKDGFVFTPKIDGVAEMADMISASRNYQNNIEVLNTTKEMLLRTLQLGQG